MADGPSPPVRIRAATSEDAAAIARIYAPYVTESAVSFETQAPDTAAMRGRIEAGGELYPWFVAEEGGAILGYAYASAFRARMAYRFAVETSVYLDPAAQRQGLGRRLYQSLLDTLETQGFAQAIAAITLPNPASLRLHEALGFAPAGTYRRIGHKMGCWHDVGLWQRPLAQVGESPREPLPLTSLGQATRQRR